MIINCKVYYCVCKFYYFHNKNYCHDYKVYDSDYKVYNYDNRVYSCNQGGLRQEIIGGAPYSNDDVIISMTSLLLLYLVKILGEPGPNPRPPPAPPAGGPPAFEHIYKVVILFIFASGM